MINYNDKFNAFQLLESNYIDSNCLYSQKRLILKKWLINFTFSILLIYKLKSYRSFVGLILPPPADPTPPPPPPKIGLTRDGS